MADNMIGKSMSGRDFGAGEGEDTKRAARLMSTTAKDCADCITGTNELKAFEGKSGKPSGPFGTKGKEF